MAKKKKSVEYSNQNIIFTIDTTKYKLIRFHPSMMTVDVKVVDDATQKGMQQIGFANLPREIKQLLKPQK
jgi:hypothetical protein